MVARTKPEPTALAVSFFRDGDPPETIFARDSNQAWGHALNLIAKRQFLQAGDVLAVRQAGDDEPDADQLVESLRAPSRGTP